MALSPPLLTYVIPFICACTLDHKLQAHNLLCAQLKKKNATYNGQVEIFY